MRKVVRAVVAVGRMRNQRRRERFVWGEGFGLEHCATCHKENRFRQQGIGAEVMPAGKVCDNEDTGNRSRLCSGLPCESQSTALPV
ncbi:hypothetical protein GCM10008012_26910 [Rhizobium anhuiense]|nr:hypothetical protein GCM10008012_26910 [Rhizobium anhuiense]